MRYIRDELILYTYNEDLAEISIDVNIKLIKYQPFIIKDCISIVSHVIRCIPHVSYNCATLVVNKYLTLVLKYGDKYDIMRASILSLYIYKKYSQIKISYKFCDGLITCLYNSVKWNDTIYNFENKILIYSYNIYDILIYVVYNLHFKIPGSYINILNDIILICKYKCREPFNIYISENYLTFDADQIKTIEYLQYLIV